MQCLQGGLCPEGEAYPFARQLSIWQGWKGVIISLSLWLSFYLRGLKLADLEPGLHLVQKM